MGATWRKRGKKSWIVTVHHNNQRQFCTVHTEQDAKMLVQHIHKQELAGVNVVEAIEKARTKTANNTFPMLKDGLPEWLEGQVKSGEIRQSTADHYLNRLSCWVWPTLGDTTIDQVTREAIGAVITKAKTQGRSMSLINQLVNPLRGYYRHLVETKVLTQNPAADLKFYIGKRAKRKGKSITTFFTTDEGPVLVKAAEVLHPRWAPFILTGLLAGLRWGESAALYKSDVDFRRHRIHVQRTLSKGGRIEAPKDHEGRWVVASKKLLDVLRVHCEVVNLDAQHGSWSAEQRQLVFPSVQGKVATYARFVTGVWRPLLRKAGLPYRKYHSTRHSFATWMLESGADIRYVSNQLGHSSIAITCDVYGHVEPSRHEASTAKLDEYV